MRIWVFFAQRLALFRTGLLDFSACKDTTEKRLLQRRIFKFLASELEVLAKCGLFLCGSAGASRMVIFCEVMV